MSSAAAGNLVKSSDVMAFFGYKTRPSFWEFVHANGLPHIRLNARRIMFDPVALNHWLARRDTSGKPRQFAFVAPPVAAPAAPDAAPQVTPGADSAQATPAA